MCIRDRIHIDMNYDCDDILDLDTIKIQTEMCIRDRLRREEPCHVKDIFRKELY